MSRLALGTVQFGLPYGIANNTGRVAPEAVGAILAEARAAGVTTLDTAIGYGESESVLGAVGVAEWQVVTKLPGLGEESPASWVPRQIEASLNRLKIDSLHAVLLHRPGDLTGPYGPELYSALVALRETGQVAKVGYSIYSPSELDSVFEAFPADIIQAPFNAFDQRLEASGWLSRLSAQKVECHTRSAFLQGLLLLDADKRPAKFGRWAGEFRKWDRWCLDRDGDRLAAALGAPLARALIDRVIVGVDSLAQLRQILLTSCLELDSPPTAMKVDDEDLLNPARWENL